MQQANTLHSGYQEEADSLTPEADEAEAVVVLEWAVPTAAKVPAPRQRVPMAIAMVRPTSITSTVPATIILELKANNTVLPTNHWCTTATLTAAPSVRVSR